MNHEDQLAFLIAALRKNGVKDWNVSVVGQTVEFIVGDDCYIVEIRKAS